ncbi:hypothetical protein [Streptomyces sp. PR69]|uniref:hypothetical protein n=1 Tax=Streptomyces sp. PR69 TaxID=2984950 RepID=UPI002264B3F1|nr:hypothetical protein [Streptomyces sp. PR69]
MAEISVKALPPWDFRCPGAAGPGTYQVSGKLEDCCWERTRQDGTIIDNQFASQARKITVTVRAGELFKSDGCGTWSLVK